MVSLYLAGLIFIDMPSLYQMSPDGQSLVDLKIDTLAETSKTFPGWLPAQPMNLELLSIHLK